MLLIDLQNNYYSASSLYAIIAQIAMMMIDRYFYLKGHLLGKIIFHCLYSLFIIIYLFFVIPYTTNTSFWSKWSVVWFFFLQICYIIVSSLQISHGYPTFDNYINSIINKKYSLFNQLLFYCYKYIPFLFEIHQILDWAISNTSLNLMHWLKVYSAHATLYISECRSLYYSHNKYEREQRKRMPLEKISLGSVLMLLLIFVLILPLMLFSSISPALTKNEVVNVKVSADLIVDGEVVSIYSNSNDILLSCNDTDHTIWLNIFRSQPTVTSLLSSAYSNTQQRIIVRDLNMYSWSISSRFFDYLQSRILVTDDVEIQMEIAMDRSDESTSTLTLSYRLEGDDFSTIYNIMTFQNETLILKNFIPRVVRLGSTSVYVVDEEVDKYRDVAIQLVHDNEEMLPNSLTWRCYCRGKNNTNYIDNSDFYEFDGMDEWTDSILEFWTISDFGLSQLIYQSLSSLGSVGIVGLYATIMVSLGAIVRNVIPTAWNIVYITLSNPLPLLQLIDVMEVCRLTNYPNHSKDEFRIWYIVMKIFRSPALLCRFTKKPPTQGVILDDDDYPLI